MSLLVFTLDAQNLVVEGKTKITVIDTVTDVSANVVRQTDGTLALRQYKIGDKAQGGIVFYVDESGEHGLAADTVDLSPGTRWWAGKNGNTQAKGDGPFAGEMNTAIIISSQVWIGDDGFSYAARACAELQKGGYGDWYLPSKEELNLMWKNLHRFGCPNEAPTSSFCPTALGGFASFYWSSSEINDDEAWLQDFDDGIQFGDFKGSSDRVRAIRAF